MVVGTLKSAKLRKVLKHLKKGKRYNARSRKWEVPNPKTLAWIRQHIERSRQKMVFYRLERNYDREKLMFWTSEFEGYIKVLGGLA